jgi:WhiB family redox-sensing transcriptional regulator
MPNYCTNHVHIHGKRENIAVLWDAITDVNEVPNLMAVRPRPDDIGDDWYGWCIQNWGTKWPMEANTADKDDDRIYLQGDTAWSPPLALLTSWERASDLQWYDDAACRGRPTQWWFAGDGRNLNSRTSKRAVEICSTCPALEACREWSLSLPQPWHGIFAGMSPQQRQQEKQRRDNDTRNDT